MKTRILCALLALFMIASLLPMAAMAADPDITVTFFNKGIKADVENKTPGIYISLTIKPGDAAKYITTNAEGKMTEHTDATAPADNFIKLEYPADGAANLKVTLKNINIDGMGANDAYHAPSIEFGAGAYSVNMELIGDSKIADGELELCPLTFQDIHEIKEVFKDRLKAIYHTRISYPEEKKTDKQA
jgi:hypothetical protein